MLGLTPGVHIIDSAFVVEAIDSAYSMDGPKEGLVRSKTAIYITGLPTTVGQLQISDICKGIGKIKKIKVYREGGIPKGDATVVFEAKKSRDVAAEAVLELDGKDIDQGGLGSYRIHVQEAEFRPAEPKKVEKKPVEEPQKRFAPDDAPAVLLKNLFDTTKTYSAAEKRSLEDQVGLECMRYGRALDAEFRDDGILVSFASSEAARVCAASMHGRYFDERVIHADHWPQGRRQAHQPHQKKVKSDDYVGAPPPRTGPVPAAYVEPHPDGPTKRVLLNDESSSSKPSRPLAFVKASKPDDDVLPPDSSSSTGHQQPPPPPTEPSSLVGGSSAPPQQRPAGGGGGGGGRKRTAADFFDD